MIISVTGLIGSGKDSIASYLIENYYFEKESFAGSLKDAAAAVFGWDRELVEGATRISREWREKIDPWWAERLSIPHLTPRWVLQNWGTEVFRQHFHNDIWIASLENKLQHKEKNVVLTDSRFPNELKMVREQAGSLLIRVKRGEDPTWFPLAQQANQGDQKSKDELQNLGIHASEYSWVGENFNLELPNDGTLDELFSNIDSIMENLHLFKSQE
jgi:hypothetical protein